MMDQKLQDPEIWQKSYLIEIQYPDGTPEVFTFSLPPEGSEITIPQRTSETKTFGGLFIDDYGTEAAKIHLSGSTGNSYLKKIYRGESASETWLSGKEEIFYLRDRIIRFKEQKKMQGQRESAKMYLYNLETDSSMGYANRESSAFVDGWEVSLRDFKITRSKDKPLTHNYSIDFTGIRLLGESKIATRAAPSLNQNSQKKLNALQKMLNGIEKWYGLSEDVKNAVQAARNAVSRYSAEVERYLAMITGSLENYIQVATDAVNIVTDVYNTFKRITMAPADSALRMINSLKDIRETVEKTIKDIKSLPEQWGERYGAVGEAVQSEIDAYKSYFEDKMQEAENTGNSLYAETVSGGNPEVTIVPKTFSIIGGAGSDSGGSGGSSDSGGSGEENGPGSAEVSLDVVVSYGYMRHVANSETNLEKLAEMYLGDPEKAQTIALINGITGNDEINPGDQIKIPILSENSLAALNQIFGSVNNRDVLGIDIAMANGILEVGPNGDFITQTDYENMDQAIRMRLSESIGNRIRLSTYGIRNVAGIPDSVASAYIATSIKDTVLQDPRVQKIDNLYFSGAGDTLIVDLSYYTYDGIFRQYKGVL